MKWLQKGFCGVPLLYYYIQLEFLSHIFAKSLKKRKKKKQDFSHLVDGCVEEKTGEGGDED